MSDTDRDEKIMRGLAALPSDALAAFAHALHARDWGAAISVLRTVLAELDERRAALRDQKISLGVQRLEVDAQGAALEARSKEFANRNR